VYLIHTLVLKVVGRALPHRDGFVEHVTFVAVALPITFFVAELLHRLVERPLIEWGRRRSGRRAPTAPRAPVESGT
jgi:peptidoglycan/LPS O-acetylase OafA/YrhL